MEKEQTTAATWKQRFEDRKQKLQPMFEDARKYYDIMYAVQNTDKISPWKSKVYVPILASKAWDLIARMSDVVPWFNVTVKNELEIDDNTGNFKVSEQALERQRRIEAKLHYDYNCFEGQPMKLRVFDPLVDAVVAGTGYAYAPWLFQEKKKYGRAYNDDGEMDNENVIVKKSYEGRNDFRGINFYNVFPADADNFFEAPYLIVRGFKPLVDLKKTGRYENLDKLDTSGETDKDFFDQFNVSRNRIVNENDQLSTDETVEMVTYYECYERTEDGVTLTTYAEGAQNDENNKGGWVTIRPTSQPYWHGQFPVVPFYCRKKSYSVFGESLFENNRTLQSATNDLFNHYLDNWNLSIESMLMYEDGSLTNDFVIEPGGEISYTGEAPKQFKFPEPNPTQLSVVMGVLEKGIEQATISQYASGVPDSGMDKTRGTAYGIEQITEAATTKIGFFRDNFKQSMRTVGQIWLSNLQQFSDEPSEIRRVVDGREVPDVVMPSDYQGEMDLDIDDDSLMPLSKQEKRRMHQAFLQELAQTQQLAMTQAEIFGDPTDIPRYNFHEINQDTAELSSKKDFERYLLPSEVQPKPPVDDTKEFLNFNYKDAPPDVKAQIEEKMDLEPSSMHDSELVNRAYQMAKEQGEIENGGADAGNQPGMGRVPIQPQ